MLYLCWGIVWQAGLNTPMAPRTAKTGTKKVAKNKNCRQQPFLKKEDGKRYLWEITATNVHKTFTVERVHICSGFYCSLWQNVTLTKDAGPHKCCLSDRLLKRQLLIVIWLLFGWMQPLLHRSLTGFFHVSKPGRHWSHFGDRNSIAEVNKAILWRSKMIYVLKSFNRKSQYKSPLFLLQVATQTFSFPPVCPCRQAGLRF